MTRNDIIASVQSRMSDIIPTSQTEVVSYPYVDTLLDDCVEGFYLLAPAHLLPTTNFDLPGTTRVIPSDEVIITRIKTPDDFVRLISFRCSEWGRAASNVLIEGTPKHHAQLYKHTFGGNARPNVTLVNDDTLGQAIEYYNYKGTTPTVTVASCVKKTDPTLIPDNIIIPFTYYVASVAFDAMGEYDAAKVAIAHAQEYLNK